MNFIVNDVWQKKCVVTGVSEFTSQKGTVLRCLLFLTSSGDVQKLFLADSFDLSKIQQIKRFGEYLVSIKINGRYINVVDIVPVENSK